LVPEDKETAIFFSVSANSYRALAKATGKSFFEKAWASSMAHK
jgi:hypothetical protein